MMYRTSSETGGITSDVSAFLAGCMTGCKNEKLKVEKARPMNDSHTSRTRHMARKRKEDVRIEFAKSTCVQVPIEKK